MHIETADGPEIRLRGKRHYFERSGDRDSGDGLSWFRFKNESTEFLKTNVSSQTFDSDTAQSLTPNEVFA